MIEKTDKINMKISNKYFYGHLLLECCHQKKKRKMKQKELSFYDEENK